ncbi:MAG: hypothetical protein NTW87_26435, partial [Planctomycetota bacterium]|nr:hypothetical protein [Planctomycetota bacterium]
MKLEWYRQHKKFVYWILLPVMVVTMGIFGASSALQSGGSRVGPSARYKVGDTWRDMGPSEVLNARYVLNQYNPPHNRYVSSVEAVRHQVAWRTAALAGFELGDEEFKERLLQEIKGRTQQQQVSEKVYRKLLQSVQLTPVQFENTTREMGQQQKLFEYLRTQSLVDDKELFVAYAREKEVVRLRYKEFKGEDFLDKTKEPSEEKVKEFYDDNKENVKELKDVMFSKPKLSADMLFLDTEKLFGGEVKPADDELKKCYEKNKALWKEAPKTGEPAPAAGAEKYKPLEEVKAAVEAKWKEEEVQSYYDRYKRFYWPVPPKPGEAAPPAGEEKYKPFAEVKDEVEKKWKNEQLAQRGQRRLQRLGEEVAEAEKAWIKAQEAKPEAERKLFDLADWAKKQNLVYWPTD